MKRAILAVCLCLFTQGALAGKMQDFSLSPGESSREPDITRSNNRFDPYANQYGSPTGNNPGSTPNQPLTNMPYPADANNKRFMDDYCNTQAPSPLTANLQGMQECLKTERQQVCDLYGRTSTGVQRVISDAAECLMQRTGEPGKTTNCDVHAAARLGLLQQNWRDQNTVWALAFIPEQVASGSSNCLPGGAK
jgi:hypothetical protein